MLRRVQDEQRTAMKGDRGETKNRPLRVSDNKNIKISLKAQAHFSGFNDCKHTGKYKILYAFSAFVQ